MADRPLWALSELLIDINNNNSNSNNKQWSHTHPGMPAEAAWTALSKCRLRNRMLWLRFEHIVHLSPVERNKMFRKCLFLVKGISAFWQKKKKLKKYIQPQSSATLSHPQRHSRCVGRKSPYLCFTCTTLRRTRVLGIYHMKYQHGPPSVPSHLPTCLSYAPENLQCYISLCPRPPMRVTEHHFAGTKESLMPLLQHPLLLHH